MNNEFLKNYKLNEIIDSLPNKFNCKICKEFMIEPYVLTCCWKSFCLDCKNEFIFSGVEKCPDCNIEIHIILNKGLIEDIKEKEIICLNSNQCIWKGPIKSFENHCEKCRFMLVECDFNCKEKIRRNELIFHKLNECEEKEIPCELCNITLKRKNYFIHTEEECNEILIDCPNQCKLNEEICKIKNKNINQHILLCQNQICSCVICNKLMMRKDIDIHLAQNINSHVLDIHNKMIDFKKKDEKNEEKFFEFNNEIFNLKNIIGNLKQEITNQNKEIIKNREQIEGMKEIIEKFQIKKGNENNGKEEKYFENDQIIQRKDTISNINPDTKYFLLDKGSNIKCLIMFTEDLLVSGGVSGDIKFWNINNYTLIDSIEVAHKKPINFIFKLNQNKLLSGSNYGKTTKIWEMDSKNNTEILRKRMTNFIKLSNGNIAFSEHDAINIWEFTSEDRELAHTLHMNSNNDISCIIEIEKENIVFGYDEKILFWNWKMNKVIKKIKLNQGQKVNSLLKINNHQFASGSYGFLNIWGYPSGICEKTFIQHFGKINCLILLESDIIASGSDDMSIKILNIRQRKFC